MASGSSVFCTLKNRQSMLPKRFALRMSWDFACFLFKLRNAGAYIPKGTPCTLHVSTNLLINRDRDFLSRTHVSWKLLSGVCHRRFLTCHTHLHLCAHTINNRGGACKCGRLTNAHSQVDAWCISGRLCQASVSLPLYFRDLPAAAEFPLAQNFPLFFQHPASQVPQTPVPHAFRGCGVQHSWRQCPTPPWSSLATPGANASCGP